MISISDFDKFNKQAQRWLNSQDLKTDIVFDIMCCEKNNYILAVISNDYLERETKLNITKNVMRMMTHYRTMKKIKAIEYMVCCANKENIDKYYQSKLSDVGTTKHTSLGVKKDDLNG